MNTKQLYYAIELAQSRSFSQVAEKLGISQPALSKQILHLEKELGVKLFDRNTIPLSMTSAGEHFIAEARKLLYQEDQLQRSMEEYKTGKRGRLVIGISPFRAMYLVSNVAKKIKERYPEVQIILNETGSDQLRKEAAEGKYDLAIVNLPVDESVLDVSPLESDTLVLAVPKTMLETLPTAVYDQPLSPIALEDCRELPFVVVGQTQELRQLFEKACAAADFRPKIAMEVVGLSTAWAMSRVGIGATLLPLQFIDHVGLDDSIALFMLRHSVRSRQPVIVTRRGQYLSEYAKYAIELLTEQAKSETVVK